MFKRFFIGLVIGCILAVSIILVFDIQNLIISFIIGLGCGGTSVSVALSV